MAAAAVRRAAREPVRLFRVNPEVKVTPVALFWRWCGRSTVRRGGRVSRPGCPCAASAQEIMARVAETRTRRRRSGRTMFTCARKMASRKGRTVLCEELTDYRITPSSRWSHDQLLKLDGRLRVKGKYVSYKHSSRTTTRVARRTKTPQRGARRARTQRARIRRQGFEGQRSFGQRLEERRNPGTLNSRP